MLRRFFDYQVEFLGYRAAVESRPGETLWLAASSQRWTRPAGVRFEDHDSVAELRFAVTAETFDEVMDDVYRTLCAIEERGTARLSLPEALWAVEPTGTAIGSWKQSEPVQPGFRVQWADIDAADSHAEPVEGARYPLPTAEEAYEIASAIRDDFNFCEHFLVRSGGGWQVYLRTTEEVTDENFRAYLIRVEERVQRHLDLGVVGRHGPVRAWSHIRREEGKEDRQVRPISWAWEHGRDVTLADLAVAPGAWGNAVWGKPEAKRYKARIAEVGAVLEARRAALEARASKTAEGAQPGDRMAKAMGASAFVNAVYGAQRAGERMILRTDADIRIVTAEDGVELVITDSTISAATLKTTPGKAASSWGLLCAAVGGKAAGAVARAFDGKFDELVPWLRKNADRLEEAAAELAPPRRETLAEKYDRVTDIRDLLDGSDLPVHDNRVSVLGHNFTPSDFVRVVKFENDERRANAFMKEEIK